MLLSTTTGYGFASSQLSYVRGEGAEQCPDQAAIRAEVEGRLGYDPFLPGSDRTIAVTIERRGDRLAGRVELIDAKGESHGLRVVTTDLDHCVDLVGTLALTISIAIDPTSAAPPTAPPADTASANREPAGPPKPAASTPPAQDVTHRPLPLADAAATPGSPRPRAPSIRWALGLGTFESIRINPELATGGLVFGAGRVGNLSFSADVRADLPVRNEEQGFRSHTLLSNLAACTHQGPFFGCLLGSPGVFFASDGKHGSAFFLLAGGRLGGEMLFTEALGLQLHADLLLPVVRPRVIASSGRTWDANVLAGSLGAVSVWHFR